MIVLKCNCGSTNIRIRDDEPTCMKCGEIQEFEKTMWEELSTNEERCTECGQLKKDVRYPFKGRMICEECNKSLIAQEVKYSKK